MALFDAPRSAYAPNRQGGFANLFTGYVSIFAAWNDARATRKALSKLTDRELNDIGLTRGDIENVTHGR